MKRWVFQGCVCCVGIIFCCALSQGKAWHGIVPLHSTRADVRRELGKPLIGEGHIELFESEAGHVHVMYARGPCEVGLPADWGNWNVAKDTVVNISITLNQDLRLKDLKVRNLEKYRWYTDRSGATYYHDYVRGIEYQVEGDLVTGITYGPAFADRQLHCNPEKRRLRY